MDSVLWRMERMLCKWQADSLLQFVTTRTVCHLLRSNIVDWIGLWTWLARLHWGWCIGPHNTSLTAENRESWGGPRKKNVSYLMSTFTWNAFPEGKRFWKWTIAWVSGCKAECLVLCSTGPPMLKKAVQRGRYLSQQRGIPSSRESWAH